jgi:hypothetical protein
MVGRLALCSIVTIAALTAAGPAHAQRPLAAEPQASFQVRLGAFFLSGDRSFWKETEALFTFDSSDLDDAFIGASYVTAISNRVEIGFHVDYFTGSARSADRFFVDEFGDPILHDSKLRLLPVSVDVRVLPAGRYAVRGRRGQYAVRRPAAYVGAGAGLSFWRYEEIGDFVDETASPPVIVFSRFRDEGTALAIHVLAGVEFPLSARAGVLLEGRYTWADDTISGDFGPDAGEIDLGGASLGAGLSFRF